jgi:hypothetical protein
MPAKLYDVISKIDISCTKTPFPRRAPLRIFQDLKHVIAVKRNLVVRHAARTSFYIQEKDYEVKILQYLMNLFQKT